MNLPVASSTTSFYEITPRWFGLFHQAVRIDGDTDDVEWRGSLRLRKGKAINDMMSDSFNRFAEQFILGMDLLEDEDEDE